MSIVTAIALVWCHALADFVLQDREMALNKSKKLSVLAEHCLHHAALFFVVLLFLASFKEAILYSGVNAILHGIVDWNIWRGFKNAHADKDIATFRYWEHPTFWQTIGCDQALHYTCLILTAWWLL
jgi:hypothetical protein